MKVNIRKIIREEILKEFMDIRELGKKAEREIEKYNFARLFAQPAENNKSNIEMKKLMEFRLNDCSESIPSLKLLIPDMFVITGATGATDARYDAGSGEIKGIIPSTFYGGLQTQYVLDAEKMKIWVKYKVQEKLKYLLNNK